MKDEQMPPEGFYLSALDWLKDLDGNLAKRLYKEIYPDETIQLPVPKGIDPPLWHSTCKFSKAYVTVIPNGRICNGNGNVITPNNKLLCDVSCQWGKKPNEHPIFSQKQLPPIAFSSEAVATLTWQQYNNYYHWFFDILPRTHLLQKSQVHIDKYVINGNLSNEKLQYETLSILGIPKDKIITTYNDLHLKAKQLIVPSVPIFSGYPKWTCEFLRKAFLDNRNIKKTDGFKRIYISREDANYRKVLNENEVMNVLKKYGFKKVLLSSLPLDDKIKIFNSANIIISPVSSGLTHLVFCKPRTKVIEFSSENYKNPTLWKISNHVNLDYYYMVCKGANASLVPTYDNIIVDIKKLLQILKNAGI